MIRGSLFVYLTKNKRKLKGKKGIQVLIVYYRSGCHSSIKTLEWLDTHGVVYKKYRIERLTKKNLLEILALTENGMLDLFKRRGDLKTRIKIKEVKEMTFNQALDYLAQHQDIVRTPILFSHNKLLIGYNDTEIRQFMPRDYRLLYGSQITKKEEKNGANSSLY